MKLIQSAFYFLLKQRMSLCKDWGNEIFFGYRMSQKLCISTLKKRGWTDHRYVKRKCFVCFFCKVKKRVCMKNVSDNKVNPSTFVFIIKVEKNWQPIAQQENLTCTFWPVFTFVVAFLNIFPAHSHWNSSKSHSFTSVYLFRSWRTQKQSSKQKKNVTRTCIYFGLKFSRCLVKKETLWNKSLSVHQFSSKVKIRANIKIFDANFISFS